MRKILESTLPEGPSIDSLLLRSLLQIEKIISKVEGETTKNGFPDRKVIESLKDCVKMLNDMKKEEKDILGDLSNEDLDKL